MSDIVDRLRGPDEANDENLCQLLDDAADEIERLQEEKRRRVYYQEIVYFVCNAIDSIFAGTVVCGTIEEPSEQVQKRVTQMQRMLMRAKHVLRQVDEHGGPYPHYPELHIAIEDLRSAFEKGGEG